MRHKQIILNKVIKAEPYKSAVAVSTVVLFGTIAMFLYPALYKAGLIDLEPTAMGVFVGGTLHEVAHEREMPLALKRLRTR